MFECKYHLVWIPKYRKKELYSELRGYHAPWFRDLAFEKESQILEGRLKPDHFHMLISIPPKHSVAQVGKFLKGKSTIQIARVYLKKRKDFTGQYFTFQGHFFPLLG